MKRTATISAIFLFLAFVSTRQGPARAQSATETRSRTIQTGVSATPTPKPEPSPAATPKFDEESGIIKIETELVNLNVRVVDRNNRSIRNLTEADFTVFEDNVRQEIGFFSQSEVPTNYTLVVDNSGSLRQQIDKVIEAGQILVAGNRLNDETSVIRFVSSDKIEILQDFTKEKEYLNDALDNMIIEGGQTAIIDAVYLAAQKTSDYERSSDPDDRKRRALILVSDGEDRSSFYSQQQLFELLRETDVQIYVVGFVDDLNPRGGIIGKSDQSKAKNLLTKLAEETGGKAYFPSSVSELARIASDIGSEMRTQFSIGYIPSNDRRDGTSRNIRVVVRDGPNKEKRIAVTRTSRIAQKQGDAPLLKSGNIQP